MPDNLTTLDLSVPQNAQVCIDVQDLKKVYRVGSEPVFALDGVSFQIAKGEFCAIVGTSGSGKSTLLNMLAGLEPPSKGEIMIDRRSLIGLKENELVTFRRERIGFIFQSFNLIPTLNAWENVALPLTFRGVRARKRKRYAMAMLKRVGLASHILHRPTQMSGGQQQRVGIARALISNPAIVFADEPTGNLDSHTTEDILKLLKAISAENQQTLLMVTHDQNLAEYADRIFNIKDGRIIGMTRGKYA